MPANTVEAEWRVRMTSPSGSPAIQVHTPIFDRQASTARVEDTAITEVKHADNSVSTRTVVNDAITEPKHGPLSASTRVLANLAVTNGKTGNDAQDPRTIAADAIETVHLSTGLAVDGTITTGSGLTIGGIDAHDIDFPGTAAIADTGTGLFFRAVSVAVFSDSGTYTGTWAPPSSREIKTAIKPVTIEAARGLLKLEPATYRYRADWQRERNRRVIEAQDVPERWERDPDRPGKKRRRPATRTRRRHVGVMVEDVIKAGLGEATSRDERGKPNGVDYSLLTPYLIRLAQDQEERIATLEAVINQLTRTPAPDPAPSSRKSRSLRRAQ
jgi:hypothetical protein